MTRTPLVSIVMAARDAQPYLDQCLDSLLAQTMDDFELIFIDDGSVDTSAEMAASRSDERIVLLRNAEGRGLARSLNRGLDLARGRFIARMDADDVCLPERLERQVAAMESRPGVAVCGTNYEIVSGEAVTPVVLPEDDGGVRARMLFTNSVAHPTVMMRGDFLRAHSLRYDESFPAAQDYALWADVCAISGALFHTVQEALLRYRKHDAQLSSASLERQLACGDRVRERLVAALGIPPHEQDMTAHKELFLALQRGEPLSPAVTAWRDRLAEANAVSRFVPAGAVDRLLFPEIMKGAA